MEECVLSLVRRGHTVRLPVAVAAVVASDVLTSIHIYHSMWPLMGAHAIRSPILPAASGIELPGVIERYHEMLAAADVPGMLKQFDADGLVREPIGEREVHRGRNNLLRFFDRLFASGGMSLQRCALTDNGTSCALEYNLTAWGSVCSPTRRASRSTRGRAPVCWPRCASTTMSSVLPSLTEGRDA